MKHRKLRIAWSVAWGLVAMLLCALWVRSYWWHDFYMMTLPYNQVIIVGSNDGVLAFRNTISDFAEPIASWTLNTVPRSPFYEDTTYGFDCIFEPNSYYVSLPHWLPILTTIAIAGFSWIHWQFSLRTLLIATTLVAVVLGLIVWASQ